MTMRRIVLALGLLIAAFLAVFGDKSSENTISEPVQKAAQKDLAQRAFQRQTTVKLGKIDAILDRQKLIGSDENGKSLAMFGVQNWNPPPPPIAKPMAPPPPSAPAMPFQFIGKKFEDGVYEVYLANGDKTYTVVAKSVIENTYRIDAIKPPVLTMTYLPLNQSQTILIGAGE